MIHVTFEGHLGADPESRFSQKGTEIVSFRVGVSQRRRNQEGGWEDAPSVWFRVRSSRAEFAKSLTKGTRVLVLGMLEVGEYQGKDGETRTSYDVWADQLFNLSPRDSQRQAAPAGTPARATEAVSDSELEDLPFNHLRLLDEPWLQTWCWCP